MEFDFSNSKLTHNAQLLRKNMTKEERKLWYELLRDLPFRFRRQRVIGNYIVDFYCAEKQLVIELDGSQHYESEKIFKDAQRTKFLNDKGITVLRYSNLDINKNFEAVSQDIYNFLYKH